MNFNEFLEAKEVLLKNTFQALQLFKTLATFRAKLVDRSSNDRHFDPLA